MQCPNCGLAPRLVTNAAAAAAHLRNYVGLRKRLRPDSAPNAVPARPRPILRNRSLARRSFDDHSMDHGGQGLRGRSQAHEAYH